MDETKPAVFLKWAGGKRQLLPELFKHVPDKFGRYYEPFLGGGALFFAMRAKGWNDVATLSDENCRLISAYAGVKNDVNAVIRELRPMKYEREFFERTRAAAPDPKDWTSSAVWLIYLNRTCFNGLYRVNRAGKFNVPFGKYTNPTICDEWGLRAASRALERTKLMEASFDFAVRDAKREDFCYFDPPYWPVNETSNFTSYTSDGFDGEDHEHLAEVALRLKKKGVHVILSNADVPAVRKLYGGGKFQIHSVEARRSVNSKGSKRGKVGELIIT